MNTEKYMDEEKVISRGIEALMKELGPVETARFINIAKEKRLESVKRHRRWQKKLMQGEFLDQVFAE